jgi:hypothetical protein
MIWRLAGKQAAMEALSYVAPVGEGEEFISRAIEAVSPYVDTRKERDENAAA